MASLGTCRFGEDIRGYIFSLFAESRHAIRGQEDIDDRYGRLPLNLMRLRIIVPFFPSRHWHTALPPSSAVTAPLADRFYGAYIVAVTNFDFRRSWRRRTSLGFPQYVLEGQTGIGCASHMKRNLLSFAPYNRSIRTNFQLQTEVRTIFKGYSKCGIKVKIIIYFTQAIPELDVCGSRCVLTLAQGRLEATHHSDDACTCADMWRTLYLVSQAYLLLHHFPRRGLVRLCYG